MPKLDIIPGPNGEKFVMGRKGLELYNPEIHDIADEGASEQEQSVDTPATLVDDNTIEIKVPVPEHIQEISEFMEQHPPVEAITPNGNGAIYEPEGAKPYTPPQTPITHVVEHPKNNTQDIVNPVSTPIIAKPTNLIIDFNVSTPITEKHNRSKDKPINIPMASQKVLDKYTDDLPVFSADSVKTINPDWLDSYYQSIEETNTTDTYDKILNIPGSVWRNKIELNGSTIGPKGAALGDIYEEKLTGAGAIHHMQILLGAGTSITHPFWGSGVHITLRNATESELNILEETIKREKIALGRKTLGMLFNNQSVILIKHVFNFIKQHIYETNIKDLASSGKDIGDILKITDLYPLVHLSGCTIYPEGYPYNSPCLNSKPTECGSVVKEILQLTKMFWNKDSSITPSMRKFMASATIKHSVKEILAYQEEVAENSDEVIDDIHPGFKVVARIPTVNEYIESGERWIAEIAGAIQASLGQDLTDVARNALITKQAKLSRLREYVHCFDKIIYTKDNLEVSARADIEAVFNVMSSDQSVVDKVSDAIANFISRHTLTVIGIPNYKCADCSKPHNPDTTAEHSLFTPVDPLNLFFTLKDRKVFRPE